MLPVAASGLSAISNVGLDGLLFLIGVREREVRQTLVSEETSPSR